MELCNNWDMGEVIQLEDAVLAGCKRILTFLQARGLLVFRRIHVMPVIRCWRFRPCCKSKVPVLSPNEDMAGMADLMVWIKDGPCLSLEIKATKGKKSPNQQDWEKRLKAMGHEYHEIRSIKGLEDLLLKFEVKV